MSGIPRLHLPMRQPTDVIPHLGRRERHWKVGRSAHALCTKWFQSNGIPERVSSLLQSMPGLEDLCLVDAFLERDVDLGDGHRPSQTDLMAICSDRRGLFVVAVEGKVDEPFGDYVRKWRDGSPAKEARLQNLCTLLGLDMQVVDSLRYQLLHRSASAILEARRYHARRAAMVVHSFCSLQSGFKDYSDFAASVGFVDIAPNSMVGPKPVGGVEFFVGWATDVAPSGECSLDSKN
jgi:hypothetical protein